MKYRSRLDPQEVVEAFQWVKERAEYPSWLQMAISRKSITVHHGGGSDAFLTVKTPDGWKGIGRGDFIILDADRSLSVRSPKSFRRAFEKVETENGTE